MISHDAVLEIIMLQDQRITELEEKLNLYEELVGVIKTLNEKVNPNDPQVHAIITGINAYNLRRNLPK
jgi:hypothetical protein